MTGIKKFKKLDSIGKKARKFSMNQRCCVCQFATICTPATSEICTVIYEKGFRRGYNQRKEEEKDRKDVLDCVSYIDSIGVEHSREKLNLYWDFESIQETSIAPNTDWNQVEIQAAIGAMQAMIQRGSIIPNMRYQYTLDADHHKVMAIEAALYARALVEKLKKGGAE